MEMGLHLIVAGVLLIIAWIDHKTMKIPDLWNLALLICGLCSVFLSDRITLAERIIGMLIVCYFMNSARIPIFGFRVPIELFAVLALIPIFLYSGKKSTGSKAVQTVFYLFYPVHLLVLYILSRIL